MDNIDKIKKVLKEFEESSVKDYDFFAYRIESIFTGLVPARHFIIDEEGTTLNDIINESKTK